MGAPQGPLGQAPELQSGTAGVPGGQGPQGGPQGPGVPDGVGMRGPSVYAPLQAATAPLQNASLGQTPTSTPGDLHA